MPDTITTWEKRRAALCAQLAAVGEMRPGSLVARYRRCGKPACHCARPGDPGHGPCWSLTRARAGTTVTRVVPAGPAVDQTRQQLVEYRRFRALVHELLEVNVRLCDARLLAARADAAPAAEKGGSRRRSPRRSRPKSPRS